MSITLGQVAGIVSCYQARAPRIAVNPRHSFSPEETAKGLEAAHAASRAGGRAAYAELAVVMRELRAGGLTFDAIAQSLNADGHRTRFGSLFDASNVHRIVRKYAA
jgi:hypothetical protein